MWPINDSIGAGFLVLQLAGLVIVAIARIGPGDAMRRASQFMFLGWMILLTAAALILFPGNSPGILPLGTTLAVAAVGATIDLRRGDAHQPF